jgi:hypothetical protein
MAQTILLEHETVKYEFVVGVFPSRDGKIYNYYWFADTSKELIDRIERNTLERPIYLIRVKPHATTIRTHRSR